MKMSLRYGDDWQTNFSSAQESFRYMYKHRILVDVTIQATDAKSGSVMCFSAHKLILAVRSSVFADLLYKKQLNIIPVDMSPRAVDILLWYIYNDAVEGDNIEELIEASEAALYFKIYSFCQKCAERLEKLSSSICSKNVCSVLKVANYSKSKPLVDLCLQFSSRKKEQEEIFLSNDFLFLNEMTVLKLVNQSKLNICPKIKLKRVINWMISNSVQDKKLLSSIDLTAFGVDDFLDVVVEFPNFFAKDELRGILSFLIPPEPAKLPAWCNLQTTRNHTNISNSILSSSTGVELVKKYAAKLVTRAPHRFSKSTLHSLRGFEIELLLKIIVKRIDLKLVMLELAFGWEYVPPSNISIELCCNTGARRKMQPVKYRLIPSLHKYCLLIPHDIMSKGDKDFNLLLKVKASDLVMWATDGPVSSLKYRVASVPSSADVLDTVSTGIMQIAVLKPFSEWTLLVNPESGEKQFILSSLYFDKQNNIDKYLEYLKY